MSEIKVGDVFKQVRTKSGWDGSHWVVKTINQHSRDCTLQKLDSSGYLSNNYPIRMLMQKCYWVKVVSEPFTDKEMEEIFV